LVPTITHSASRDHLAAGRMRTIHGRDTPYLSPSLSTHSAIIHASTESEGTLSLFQQRCLWCDSSWHKLDRAAFRRHCIQRLWIRRSFEVLSPARRRRPIVAVPGNVQNAAWATSKEAGCRSQLLGLRRHYTWRIDFACAASLEIGSFRSLNSRPRIGRALLGCLRK
jgi:hypothetical protein